MSFILLVLFLIALYVILTPIVRIGIALYKARKQMRSFYNTMKGATGANDNNSRYGQQSAPRREKKIDPNVGEYVEFEEIDETQHSSEPTQSDTETYTTDPVEDAEWEEIE